MQKVSGLMKSIIFLSVMMLLVGCISPVSHPQPPTATAEPAAPEESTAQIANPASENCVKQGGVLTIQKRGDGGEYGVCVFEDNRQCEEWAMMRGDCPVGGLKITGYITPAAQYCVISGGEYEITDASNSDQEQGTCTFNNGQTCDVWEYFNGNCSLNDGDEQTSFSDPFAYCNAVGSIDAPDDRYTGAEMPEALVKDMIELGLVAADAPPDIQQNAVWRCMDHNVWVCTFGANLPCLEKADLSKTPSAEMSDYCKANPTSDFIPAYVTGRATVFEWLCKNGKAEAGKQVFSADPRGFIADFWYELSQK